MNIIPTHCIGINFSAANQISDLPCDELFSSVSQLLALRQAGETTQLLHIAAGHENHCQQLFPFVSFCCACIDIYVHLHNKWEITLYVHMYECEGQKAEG